MPFRHTPVKRTTYPEPWRPLGAMAMGVTTVTAVDKAGVVPSHAQGPDDSIGFSHERLHAGSGHSVGRGFNAANWPIDRDSMALPKREKLARFDPALLLAPPTGLEVGYVPIVMRQAKR